MTGASAEAPPIDVTPEQWILLIGILQRFAAGRPVWAYGSRAKRTRVKTYSDLDLIVGGEPFRGTETWDLEEAFDESRLPFRVQFQQIDSVSRDFRERIAKDFVVVQAGGGEAAASSECAKPLRHDSV